MLNWLTNWGRKPAVDPLEEKLKILEAELRDRLQESLNYYGLPGVPYPGSLDFLRPGMSDDWGFGYRNRNRRGDNPQVYLHDEQLKQVRERSRDLAARNEYARNALRVRQTYIVGTGLRTTAMPRKNLEDDARAVAAADEVQSFLEVWAAYTKLYPKQKEFQLRKDRDGEAFIRLFRGKRFLEYNFTEPEHVVDYTGQYTFGIETDPDDITKVIAYYVRPDEQGQPEKVDAEKMIHIKANVDSGIKRGLPFLYPIFNVLEKIESADENMAAIMKIQGSIAMIRRHQVARSSAVSSGVSSRADYTGNNPMTGATDNYKLYRPGTILDVDNNTEYEFPAIAANLAHMADGKSSLLRSAAAGVGMPEYMLTADAANGNFASTQVAESPAIADFLGLQHDTGEVFGAGVYVDGADNGLSWAAIAYAVEQGELNPDVLELVTLKSEGPNIVVRDRNQETQRLSLLADKGIISRDEWAKAEGREKAAQTDEEVQAAKDAEMQKQMALKQPAGKPVVKEAFDEDQHPRDDAGKFTVKGGKSEGSGKVDTTNLASVSSRLDALLGKDGEIQKAHEAREAAKLEAEWRFKIHELKNGKVALFDNPGAGRTKDEHIVSVHDTEEEANAAWRKAYHDHIEPYTQKRDALEAESRHLMGVEDALKDNDGKPAARTVDSAIQAEVERLRAFDIKNKSGGRYEAEVWIKYKEKNPTAAMPVLSKAAAEYVLDEYEADGKPLPSEVFLQHPELKKKYKASA